ncbi:MAG TPA: ScaI family restriction endonuclease [Planctomycetaceae bacterium]|nr:ScaI family restriction endonuclease [Planctomycetaceae bacterium]
MTRTGSPYRGDQKQWSNVTKRLIAEHPLDPDQILEIAQTAWQHLWQTTIGTGKHRIRLSELRVPASVVGYFFEVLFARELERRSDGQWRQGQTADEKDLVYVPDPRYSTEVKTSGQLGDKVFGNRSYGQKTADDLRGKKEKSGYYITVNFYGRTLTLLRFGWIDADDWNPQLAPTGQMAGLPDVVYRWKLVDIRGDYQLQAPVRLLPGVGPGRAEALRQLGIATVGELIAAEVTMPTKTLVAIQDQARRRFQSRR